MENPKFFSDREPPEKENDAVKAEIVQPAAEERKQAEPKIIDVAVEASEPVAEKEEVSQLEVIPRAPEPQGQPLLELSEERKNVIKVAASITNGYEGRPAPTFDFEQSAEQADSVSQSSNESGAETLVSVYKAETFEIQRQGYVVSIFDATSDSKEPIFVFEQRGQRVNVLKDKITNNLDIYKKFERASNNLETMKRRGKGLNDIFSDKTHRAQVAVLGELAPRGSTAISTAHLLTGDAEKVRTMTAESGRRISYERQVRIREGDEQPYEVITVSKYGVPPGESIIAISEDGSILSQNHPNDYGELRQNYEVAKEEHRAAKQAAKAAEERSKKPILRNQGGAER